MGEAELLEKLRKIEALHAGATSDGEREAARAAAELIQARLAEARVHEPDIVLVYTQPDPWMRKLFVALCRRYGCAAFRRPRQRASPVQVLAPATFQETTLWPELDALATELTKHLAEVTDRVIHEGVHADTSEAAEVEAPKALGQAAPPE